MRKTQNISLNGIKILRILKENEPISIKNLQEKTKIPRTTLYHHLAQLKKRDLIVEKKDKEVKGHYEIGHPVYLSTNKANPLTKKTLKAFDIILEVFK